MTNDCLTDEYVSYLPVHIHGLENRRYGRNGNGFIIVSEPHMLKRCVEEELSHIIDTHQDSVFLIDTTGEYLDSPVVSAGMVFSFGKKEGSFFNPFYIAMERKKEWQLLRQKSEFLISFCEALTDDDVGFSISKKTILEFCIKRIYEPFMESYNEKSDTYLYELLPTFCDLCSMLLAQESAQAVLMGKQLQKHEQELHHVFRAEMIGNHGNQLKMYDLKHVSERLKSAVILTILDHIQQETLEEKQENPYQWIYINDVHCLFHKPSAAEYISCYMKSSVQQKQIITGITPYADTFFESSIARALLSLSHYVILHLSSRLLRKRLFHLLNVTYSDVKQLDREKSNYALLYNKVNTLTFYIEE